MTTETLSAEKQVILLNEEGMHARPAGIFVKTASQFKSNVEIRYNGSKKNGKSVINLMSLGLRFNDEFIIAAIGEDANQAIETLASLVANKFAL